ncbi:MAG: hypothetical protein ACUVSL_05530 [Chloroflexus sp.]|uniref:hypothetical protein n=1 Tax=Chloroflexus sp. TaxID=1904827 RepID=UPI00404998EF
MGRGIATFLMIAGIALFGLLTANVAAFFVEEDTVDRSQADLAMINERLARIEQLLAEGDSSARGT